MQHWVLCELLDRLGRRDFQHLALTCTHSMAPWSTPERREDDDTHCCRRAFNAARTRAATDRGSVFESAWFALSPNGGLPYPSSAALSSAALSLEVWRSALSLALCEASGAVADEIDGWLGTRETRERVKHSVLLRGDWRNAAAGPLFLDPDADCLYVEMDPYRYDRRDRTVRKTTDPATVYPEDLNHLARALGKEDRPLVLQLSSFSAQNGNSPDAIESSTRAVLDPHRFVFRDGVAVDGQMVSLVFVRNLTLDDGPLQADFSAWLAGIG
jgi:hypothetical protein